MKIAIHDYFIHSGETAIANNLVLAGKEAGIDVRRFTNIQEIEAFEPDFVMNLCYHMPKLTRHPSYVYVNSSPEYIFDVHAPEKISSYDGYFYLPGIAQQLAEDLCFSSDKADPVICYIGQKIPDFRPRERLPNRLIYCGQNWDNRHLGLLKMLSKHEWFDIYGPKSAWKGIKVNYRGEIPYEGDALLEAYYKGGVGLALYHDLFLKHDMASGRVGEISAAGSLVITARMPFIEEHYGESVLYVDQSLEASKLYEQILFYMEWVRNNNEEAIRMAEKAKRITKDKFSAHKMLESIINYHHSSMKKGGWSLEIDKSQPEVGVIVRAGGRSLKILARCLDSLKNQIYKNIRPIIVLYKPLEDLHNFLAQYKDAFSKIDIIECWEGIRSTTLWRGLSHVYSQKIPYFGVLDDDDEYFPNHISNLAQLLESQKDAKWAYALSATEYFDKQFEYFHMKENRAIELYPFLAKTNDEEEAALSTCGVLINTNLLDEDILKDPFMHTGEDSYLWRHLFLKNLPVPSFRCTSLLHREGDNSNFATHPFRQIDMLKLKTRFLGRRQHNGQYITTDLTIGRPKRMPSNNFDRLCGILKKIIFKGPGLVKKVLLKIEEI